MFELLIWGLGIWAALALFAFIMRLNSPGHSAVMKVIAESQEVRRKVDESTKHAEYFQKEFDKALRENESFENATDAEALEIYKRNSERADKVMDKYWPSWRENEAAERKSKEEALYHPAYKRFLEREGIKNNSK